MPSARSLDICALLFRVQLFEASRVPQDRHRQENLGAERASLRADEELGATCGKYLERVPIYNRSCTIRRHYAVQVYITQVSSSKCTRVTTFRTSYATRANLSNVFLKLVGQVACLRP